MKRLFVRDTIVDYLFYSIMVNLKLLSVIWLFTKKKKVLNFLFIFYSTDRKNVLFLKLFDKLIHKIQKKNHTKLCNIIFKKINILDL